MGCTSSAPKTFTTKENTTDKFIHFSEKPNSTNDAEAVVLKDNENEQNEIKVLPTCDTLGEPVNLDRNNKTLINTWTMDLDKDSHVPLNGHVLNNDNQTVMEKENLQVEEKLSSLEDVVEKVVELYVVDGSTEKVNQVPDDLLKTRNSTESTEEKEPDRISNELPIEVTECEHNEEITENLGEAISPSQSTSSRATRWEALADIAAELPPSLAVDPVTGQIYALSK